MVGGRQQDRVGELMITRCDMWEVPLLLESVLFTLEDGNTTTATNALIVASDSPIVLTFDRAVSVSAGWFTVSCDDGAGGSSTTVIVN